MIEHCFSTEAGIDGKMNRIADLKAPFSHSASMHRELRRRALGIGDLDNVTASRSYNSSVTYLASRLAVKGRLGSNDIDFFTFDGHWLAVSVAVDGQHLRFEVEAVVAEKFGLFNLQRCRSPLYAVHSGFSIKAVM